MIVLFVIAFVATVLVSRVVQGIGGWTIGAITACAADGIAPRAARRDGLEVGGQAP